MSESENDPEFSYASRSTPLEYARPARRQSKLVRYAVLLGISLAITATLIGLYILVSGPANRRAIAAGNRVQSASNLKQIGLAMIMYANEHHGAFPDSLGTILPTPDLTPEVFVYPDGNDTPPSGATTQAVVIDLAKPGHCSYLYFGGGLSSACDSSAVLACERAMPETADGMNALMGDGRVEFIAEPAATQLRAALATGPACWTASSGVTRPQRPPSGAK